MEKHICKVCGQSFPNERSLEGHISTHAVLSSPMEDEDKPVNRYGLRNNPKKSRRFDDACPEESEKGNIHTKRAKVCSPLNSSSEMPTDELYHEKDDDESYVEQSEEMPSQFDSKVSLISLQVKKRKRSSRKVTKISVDSASPALSSKYHNKELSGALCLLMLSRGTHSITDLSDEISATEYGNKVNSCPSEDEDQQFKKPKVSSFSRSEDHGIISSPFLELEKRSLSKKGDSGYGTYKTRKRNKYVCRICNKSFPSYQALGGHCKSHKNMKGDNQELINQNCNSQTVGKLQENFERHKCSICGKTFPTGQALGGHKSWHLVAGNSSPASASASASALVVSTAGSNGANPQTTRLETEQKENLNKYKRRTKKGKEQ